MTNREQLCSTVKWPILLLLLLVSLIIIVISDITDGGYSGSEFLFSNELILILSRSAVSPIHMASRPILYLNHIFGLKKSLLFTLGSNKT